MTKSFFIILINLGDNKGLASQLFEKEMNPGVPTGRGGFVAAFASTNLGDISPNIKVIRIISNCLSNSEMLKV